MPLPAILLTLAMSFSPPTRTSVYVAVLLFAAPLAAQDAQSGGAEAVAAKLVETTVTVRILPANEGDEAEVVVCSGASLGDGLMMTFVSAAPNARFRLTLPDGVQADAHVRVTDQYSGLTLLETDHKKLPGLKLAPADPPVGAAVLTAAAAGIEKPLVSRGILGGAERTLPGTGLPPLLQCDVRTTPASSGAPVVNAAGELIGIVAATQAPGEKLGWTYAVPASHVARLVRAREADELVVLKRQRPLLGCTLAPGEERNSVRVERLQPGGPAAKSGLREGDVVTSLDGVRIRSVYQAVALVLKRQPGDKLTITVADQEQERSVEVTLGGGFVVEAGEMRIGPSIAARRNQDDEITVETQQSIAQQSLLEAGENLEEQLAAKNRRIAELQRELGAAQAQTTLLQKQIDAFGGAITTLRDQLRRSEQSQAALSKLINSLREEISRLREQLTPAKK